MDAIHGLRLPTLLVGHGLMRLGLAPQNRLRIDLPLGHHGWQSILVLDSLGLTTTVRARVENELIQALWLVAGLDPRACPSHSLCHMSGQNGRSLVVREGSLPLAKLERCAGLDLLEWSSPLALVGLSLLLLPRACVSRIRHLVDGPARRPW